MKLHPPLGSRKSLRHLIYLHLFLVSITFCGASSASSKSSILESAANLLSSAQLPSDSPTAASLRAVTSSQVIEYNPRNIVLMTMLNSMLILGGLLGTMARNEKRLGSPFKRADGSLAKFKKRWLPKKFSKGGGSKVVEVGATTTEMPSSTSTTTLKSRDLLFRDHHHHPNLSPITPTTFNNILSRIFLLTTSLPQEQMFHQPPPAALMDAIDPRSASALLNSITTANNNLPLILRRNDQQLPREHRSLSTSLPSSPSSPPSSTSSCGHVLRCLDPSGARLKEAHSPSELSQLALRLLNSSPSADHHRLLTKVRELIAFEEKGQCFLHYTCHNAKTSSPASSVSSSSAAATSALLNGRPLKKHQQQPSKASSSPAANSN
ncbi:hypothetical protein TYRP_002479 [Tyrophagus putrescentiae]|nr:hypothetical protein TYRP_002479 [Tyrophagus putrescentiae]